ncbi:hypothetical protein DCO17_03190 [Polynucleobacter tropicus]|uniref:protein O-GlcNAc transferase n=1 Tax=Polynucleobacter tropicus TaxID=1743174 RepID=A0A6M9Q2L1_9BURK|nr:tetratricopeptide repeat protein [Polynucleobacter tropicus]QKM64326.1 hypothetical protein DCO17_03190 [Polynucleobacter tropicus]
MTKKSFEMDQLQQLLSQALVFHRNNDFENAAKLYKKALHTSKNNFDALNLYGTLLLQQKDYSAALELLSNAIKLNSKNPICFNNQGICLKNLNRLDEALNSYNQAITLKPDYDEAIFNRSNLYSALKKYDEALEGYDQALKLKPQYIDAVINKANTLGELRRYDEAIQVYELALSYQPDHENALLGIAQAQRATRDFGKSFFNIDRALQFRLSPAGFSSQGDLYRSKHQFELALESYSRAIDIDSECAGAWFGKGLALSRLSRYVESIACFSRVLELDVSDHFCSAFSAMIYDQLKIASWTDFDAYVPKISSIANKDGRSLNPFLNLAFLNDSELQYELTSKYVTDDVIKIKQEPISKSLHQKIRIAYFSADFGSHPVSLLLAEVFERHNRDLFEVVAFCLKKPSSEDLVYQKLLNVFDYFLDVEDKSDEMVAKIARELEIDIAIDLGGHTQDSRLGIFAYRAAPIQINYFGYAGTSGAQFMDYIIADHVVIPPESHAFFSEKIAFMPNSYMVDDSRRLPSDVNYSRSDFGLPENKFVFCCFNNGYKFNPEILKAWANILANCPNSILWLTENNSEFRNNILLELSKLGIDSDRIFFAKRLESMADHLARYRLADVFLDTHPYNAHTTALDAFKMGIPVLTYCGKAFAGRVATSLLTCLDLKELIANSLDEYVTKAIDLYLSQENLNSIRVRLVENIKTKPLFDTRSYVNNLEVLYLEMYRRHLSGLPPETFSFEDVR